MRSLLLHTPQDMLEDRRRLGHDRWDEVWEGVLHLVPPPSSWHQRFGTKLLVILAPLAVRHELEASYETGVFNPSRGEKDYRVPDLVFARSEHLSDRGVEGRAELIVEILSPDDESREKLSFYADRGIPEVWFVDPDTRAFEVYVLRADRYHAALPDDDGAVRSQALGVRLALLGGPHLRISWPDDAHEI